MNKEMCVEYWKNENINELTNAAVMSKNLHYIKPDPKSISRRYFPNHVAAMDFANKMHGQGYLTRVF